eukprot:4628705-Amphidinium_carterae.2
MWTEHNANQQVRTHPGSALATRRVNLGRKSERVVPRRRKLHTSQDELLKVKQLRVRWRGVRRRSCSGLMKRRWRRFGVCELGNLCRMRKCKVTGL